MKKVRLGMMLGMFVWMAQGASAQTTQGGIGVATKSGSTQAGSPTSIGGQQKSSAKSKAGKSAMKSGTTKAGSGATGSMMGTSRTGTAGGNGKTGSGTGTKSPGSQR